MNLGADSGADTEKYLSDVVEFEWSLNSTRTQPAQSPSFGYGIGLAAIFILLPPTT